VISPADIFVLAVAAGLMTLEAHRGILPALVGFSVLLFGIIGTRFLYVPLSEYMRPSGAYLLLIIAVIVLAAIASTIVTKRLKINVSHVEAAIGATIGLGTGLLLGFALFDWLTIRYGPGTILIKDSLIYWALVKSEGIREITDFYRRLTGS
jgi:phosphate/sulfate permease